MSKTIKNEYTRGLDLSGNANRVVQKLNIKGKFFLINQHKIRPGFLYDNAHTQEVHPMFFLETIIPTSTQLNTPGVRKEYKNSKSETLLVKSKFTTFRSFTIGRFTKEQKESDYLRLICVGTGPNPGYTYVVKKWWCCYTYAGPCHYGDTIDSRRSLRSYTLGLQQVTYPSGIVYKTNFFSINDPIKNPAYHPFLPRSNLEAYRDFKNNVIQLRMNYNQATEDNPVTLSDYLDLWLKGSYEDIVNNHKIANSH